MSIANFELSCQCTVQLFCYKLYPGFSNKGGTGGSDHQHGLVVSHDCIIKAGDQ